MGKSYIDTRTSSKKVKTIVLLSKWDWSESVMKYGRKAQVRTTTLPVPFMPVNQTINLINECPEYVPEMCPEFTPKRS